jgi:hypothetical protein
LVVVVAAARNRKKALVKLADHRHSSGSHGEADKEAIGRINVMTLDSEK